MVWCGSMSDEWLVDVHIEMFSEYLSVQIDRVGFIDRIEFRSGEIVKHPEYVLVSVFPIYLNLQSKCIPPIILAFATNNSYAYILCEHSSFANPNYIISTVKFKPTLIQWQTIESCSLYDSVWRLRRSNKWFFMIIFIKPNYISVVLFARSIYYVYL